MIAPSSIVTYFQPGQFRLDADFSRVEITSEEIVELHIPVGPRQTVDAAQHITASVIDHAQRAVSCERDPLFISRHARPFGGRRARRYGASNTRIGGQNLFRAERHPTARLCFGDALFDLFVIRYLLVRGQAEGPFAPARAQPDVFEQTGMIYLLVELDKQNRIARLRRAGRKLRFQRQRRRGEAPPLRRAERPANGGFRPRRNFYRVLVAMGKRPSGSNNNVFAPTHRHRPFGCGESLTGGCEAARSSFEATATIGCENVTLRCGANWTSPSGENRKTSSGPATGSAGAPLIATGGNGSSMTRPVRGGGHERSRMAKSFLSSAAAVIAGNRLSRFCVASSGN